MEEIRIDIDSVKAISKRLDNVIYEISDACRNISKLVDGVDSDILHRRQIGIIYFRNCSDLEQLVRNMEQMSTVIKKGADKYLKVDIYLQKLTAQKYLSLSGKSEDNKKIKDTLYSLGMGFIGLGLIVVGVALGGPGIGALAITTAVLGSIVAINNIINDGFDLYNIRSGKSDLVDKVDFLKDKMVFTGDFILGTLDSDNMMVKKISRLSFNNMLCCGPLGMVGGTVVSTTLFSSLDKIDREQSKQLGRKMGEVSYGSLLLTSAALDIINPFVANKSKAINTLNKVKNVKLNKVKCIQGINKVKTPNVGVIGKCGEVVKKVVNVTNRTFVKPLKNKEMTNILKRKDLIKGIKTLGKYSKNTLKQIGQIKEVAQLSKNLKKSVDIISGISDALPKAIEGDKTIYNATIPKEVQKDIQNYMIRGIKKSSELVNENKKSLIEIKVKSIQAIQTNIINMDNMLNLKYKQAFK